MKAKTLSLVAAMALAANMGIAQAAELNETVGVPDILNGVVTDEATMMTQTEMETIQGALKMTGGKWWKGTRWVVKFDRDGNLKKYKGPVPTWLRNKLFDNKRFYF
jgi:hypothetical protein